MSARRIGALVLALALLAAACSSETGTPSARDAAAFKPAPEVSPIRRLGRWDGTTFVPLAPRSVRAGDVYVLVHGWAPGYLDAVRHYRGPGPLLAWNPQAVNAEGQRMFTDFFPLAAAITRDDPRATVLGFSWLDDAATAMSPFAAWKSEAHTDLNGQRLAAALGQVLAPTFRGAGGRIQLIGHSHGAKVATVAAVALDVPPDQLTLLDSPENVFARLPGAANHLEGYLPLLPIGHGAGETFVDSYFSLAGERYGGFPGLGAVVDVQLEPDQYGLTSLDDLVARHGYPVRWYTASARDLPAGVGYAWSPLVGRPPDCLQCSFVQDWAKPGGGVDRADELRLKPAPAGINRPTAHRRLEVSPLRGPATSTRPEGVVLTAPGHRLWQVEFDRAAGDLAIEFDHRFTAPVAGAQLAVWLDDRQVLTTAARWSGATGQHAVVDVSTLAVGRHTLTAVLTRPSRARAARVILGGFQVESQAVRQPGSGDLAVEAQAGLLGLALLGSIALLIGVLRRPRRSSGRTDDPSAVGGATER